MPQVSPYTLKLNDPVLHPKFIQTLRIAIAKIATRLFLVLTLVSIIYLVGQLFVLDEGKEKRDLGLEHSAMIGIPSLIAFTVSIIARRQPVIIELCSPLFVGATSIVTVVFNTYVYDGEIDEIRFKAQIWVIYTSCFISVFFLTPSYLNQVIARMVLGPPILFVTFFMNDNLNKDKFN